MGRGTWSWIVPDGLWEIAKPLIPPSRVRPQGGWAKGSKVMRRYREEDDGFTENALHGVL
jgi:hypothetical protein